METFIAVEALKKSDEAHFRAQSYPASLFTLCTDYMPNDVIGYAYCHWLCLMMSLVISNNVIE